MARHVRRRRRALALATEKDGKRTHAVHLVAVDGGVLASAAGSPESRPLLAAPFGKCMAHGAILCATDDGLVLARADVAAGAFNEVKAFPETRDLGLSFADLLPGPHGSAFLVQVDEIVHLTLV
jgi:hypothetical protein